MRQHHNKCNRRNPPYQYSINGGVSYQTSNVFTGLNQGTYSLVVKDSNGCTNSGSATLTNTNPITINTLIVNPCPNTSNGSISITATGGTGPYSYSIDGVTFQTSPTFNNLAANSYNLVVRDNTGCLGSTTVQLSSISITFIGTPPTCSTLTNGSIVINAIGGNPPYQYSIDGGANYFNSSTFNNLGNGSYTVVAKDSNNCTSQPSFLPFDTLPVEVFVTSIQNPCFGSSNGSIGLSVSGGKSPYQYSIDNGMSYQTSNIFSNLAAGSYNVVVQDANSCLSQPQTVTLTSPSITFTYTTTYSCVSSTGSITVTASGGASPYQYSSDNGMSYQPSNIFSNLAAGSYTVVVQDANGCLSPPQTVTLASPSITFTYTTAYSCVSSTGSITVTASGGASPYQYSSDNGMSYQPSNIFSNLAAGSYTVVVQDANGCLSPPQTVTLTSPSITFTYTTTYSCFSSTGSITVTASGGASPYQYSSDNGMSYQPSNTFTNLAAGSYTVVVQDANGCLSTPQTVTLTSPSITFTYTTTYSCASSTGSITVTASGGASPYQYSSDNGMSYQPSNIFSNLTAGSYTVVVQDANGCLSTPQTVTLTALSFTYSFTNPTCANSADGSIIITASGGTAPYQYSLDNGTTFQSSNVFNNLPGGPYTLLVKDANNCLSAAQNVTLTPVSTDDLMISNLAPTNPSNPPDCDNGQIIIGASGGTPPYQYTIDNGANWASSGTFTNLGAGTYYPGVMDEPGCIVISQPVILTCTMSANSFALNLPVLEDFQEYKTPEIDDFGKDMALELDDQLTLQMPSGILKFAYNNLLFNHVICNPSAGNFEGVDQLAGIEEDIPYSNNDQLAGTFTYHAYTFSTQNSMDVPVCAIVENKSDSEMFALTYVDHFNPQSPLENNLAASRILIDSSKSFLFYPAQQKHILVIYQQDGEKKLLNYDLRILTKCN